MKLRNRILSAVMAVVASMAFIGTSAFAADGYEYDLVPSVDGKIEAGTEFTVNVDFTENAGLFSFVANVSYDAEGLELLAAPTDTALLGGQALENAIKNPYKLFYNDGLRTDDNTATGTVATFRFKAIKDGSWNISITNDAENTNNQDWDECDFGTKTITIEVGEDGPSIVEATKVVEDKNNKADKAEGEAYTQGFKVTVTGNDQVVTAVPFTLTADGTTKAFAGFTGLEITGATPAVLGLNVKGVPADKTVTAEFSLTIAE